MIGNAGRYETTIRRQRDRLDAALKHWPAMVETLRTFAEGGEASRPAVERAMREVLAALTLPVLPYLTGVYMPAQFWRKEPIAKLIATCNARLFADEELVSQAEAARELGVSQVQLSRWIASGALKAVPILTTLPRTKPGVHHMLLKRDVVRPAFSMSDVSAAEPAADQTAELATHQRSGNDRRQGTVLRTPAGV